MELLLDGQLQTRASAGPTEARERGTIEKRGERGTTRGGGIGAKRQ